MVIVDDDEDVQEILDDGDGMEAPLPKTPILSFRVGGVLHFCPLPNLILCPPPPFSVFRQWC